ncbi:SET domain-containing protein [Roseateles amylovorans]|uniref:SET domain-containing protein n=1 Tax=Roseateles amylovorans TaxID=2978473 RepID=A0ABY6AZ83_9BURK|nr:SET domain-containing protein [Roseateles amylovorans]UXH78267.1 SET domain-containing protein [Roseateles amylovorans]
MNVAATTTRTWDKSAVDRLLWERYHAIHTLPRAQRRRAHMDHVLSCRERLLSLMPAEPDEGSGPAEDGPRVPSLPADSQLSLSERTRQLELLSYGTERWLALLQQVRNDHRQRVTRRAYRHDRCGDPPFRDADHGVIHILDVLDRPDDFADVEPFTASRNSRRTRSSTCLRHLEPRQLTAADLRSPSESALIGQWGVFARTHIPAGTCLGVYGGQLMDEVDIFLLDDDRYLMAAAEEPGTLAVNGENLMSLMNTLFTVDAEGRVTGHPETGYNVSGESFRVAMRHGWQARIHAFRAATDIPAGTELRWNYDLGERR